MAEPHRSLTAILDDVITHGVQYPTHGTNCVCMDKFIIEIKRQIYAVLPTSETEPNWESRVNAGSRVIYVMRASTRYL